MAGQRSPSDSPNNLDYWCSPWLLLKGWRGAATAENTAHLGYKSQICWLDLFWKPPSCCQASMLPKGPGQAAMEGSHKNLTQLQHLWTTALTNTMKYPWRCNKQHSHDNGNQQLSNWMWAPSKQEENHAWYWKPCQLRGLLRCLEKNLLLILYKRA